MSTPQRIRPQTVTALLVALTAAVLVAYIAQWLAVRPKEIGRSDFTAGYVAATLWNTGPHQAIYDPSAQAALHARLIAPDTEGNLPFPNPPTAAVSITPLAHLGLAAAYRVFCVLQLIALLAGTALAICAAPAGTGGRRRTGAFVVVALPSTLVLLLLGQWDGVIALALGAGYFLWRRERFGTAGWLIAFGMTALKPHLAIGLGAFLLGTRNWRAVEGAAAGVLSATALDIAAVGTTGIHGFITAVSSDVSGANGTTAWNPASFLGFFGFLTSWIGNNAVASAAAVLLGVIAVVICLRLGALSRTDDNRLEALFTAAVALSLLISPHVLLHDMVLLAPPLAAWLAARITLPQAATAAAASIGLLAVAEILDFGNSAAAPPGRLTPLVLMGTALFLWRTQGERPVRR